MLKKLFIYIGTGKTGSTSLQSFFEKYSGLTSSISYWGINLDTIVGGINHQFHYEWQKKEGIAVIQKMNYQTFNNELLFALNELFLDENKEYAIWINESIFHMSDHFLKPISIFSAQNNVEIAIIGAARDYPSYLASAYQQWGVKHKTYEGPIQDFEQWCNNAKDFLQYSKWFSRWECAFAGKLKLINFQNTEDIIKKVLDLLPEYASKELLPYLSQSIKSNISNNIVRHLIFSILNNRFQEQVLPTDSELFVNQYPFLSDDTKFAPFHFSKVLPHSKAMHEIISTYADEISSINNLLEKSGEAPLDIDVNNCKDVSEEECIQMLINVIFSILYHQSEEIKELKGQCKQH